MLASWTTVTCVPVEGARQREGRTFSTHREQLCLKIECSRETVRLTSPQTRSFTAHAEAVLKAAVQLFDTRPKAPVQQSCRQARPQIDSLSEELKSNVPYHPLALEKKHGCLWYGKRYGARGAPGKDDRQRRWRRRSRKVANGPRRAA